MSIDKQGEVAAGTPTNAAQLYDRLPPRPAPELDRVLDAVERCLARHGVPGPRSTRHPATTVQPRGPR